MTEIKKESNINEIQETNNEKRKLEENSSDIQVNKKHCVAKNDKTTNEEINDFQQNNEINQGPNASICIQKETGSNNIQINNKVSLAENLKNYKIPRRKTNDFEQNIEIKQESNDSNGTEINEKGIAENKDQEKSSEKRNDSQQNIEIEKQPCERLLQVLKSEQQDDNTAAEEITDLQPNSCASNTETTGEVASCSTSSTEIKSEAPILFNGKDITTLSKSQMKKYQKMLSWEAKKKEKRQKEKLRAKMRKIELKKNNIYTGPTRKELKRRKMCHSPCKTGVIIDLSFDDLMIPKDLGKVIKQLLRVYTVNRRSETPMQLHITSFEGKSKEEMKKNDGYEKWDCYFHPENYIDIFPKEKLVYLSSESDNVITELDQDKFYIIGGLVDHNAHKGLCYKKAVEQGIQHGQLPISDFFTIRTRKVFTINQVFEILLKVSEGLSFKEAIEVVLPQRINLVEKESDVDEEYEDDDDEI